MQDAKITQVYEISPEELKTEILSGVRRILSEFLAKESSNQDRLYSRQEVAKMLKISLPTLRNYVKRGLIEEHRIGKRVLYKSSDIEAAVVNLKNRGNELDV